MWVVVICVLIAIVIAAFQLNKRKSNINEAINTIDGVKETYDQVQYLGGHPLVETGNIKEGALILFKDSIHFINPSDNSECLFSIKISDIRNCSSETKESLTLSRILLTGIFAWAIKKNRKYIRIEFKNELNDSNSLILFSKINNDSSTAKIISQTNKTRLEFLQN